jgi:ribosomal-protein-alanine N-acetyltransferase
MKTLKIDTKRLLIRNLQDSDLSDFNLYRSNSEVMKYQGIDTHTLEQSKAFIKSQLNKQFGKPGEWVQYGIENKINGKLIGDCAIKLDDSDIRIAEVGITISHKEQRNGFAKETLIGILNFLFSIDSFHRVSEIVDVENIASIKMLESIGFLKEGHFIENVFFNGKWGSEFQYALNKNEWQKRRIILNK